MKRLILLLILVPFLFGWGTFGLIDAGVTVGGTPGSGTDWTADASLEAYYQFESAGLNLDETANNNDLACAYTCPTANTTNYISGSQAVNVTSVDDDKAYSITQPNLNADFPANGTGDDAATIAGWFRINTLASSDWIFNASGSITSASAPIIFGLWQTDSSGNLNARINGDQNRASTGTVSADTWYFFSLVYSDADNTLMLYLRDQDGSSLYEYATTTTTDTSLDDMGSSGGFLVGARAAQIVSQASRGQLDEVAVFSRAFSKTELDGVFTYGWGGTSW